MKGFKRKLLFMVITIGILHHIVMEGLYLLPLNPLTKNYHKYVTAYINPIFSQRWQLFAPEPALYSLKFWYRCGDSEGKELPWLDPENQILKNHQSFRFTSNGKLLYIYQGIARGYINKSVELKQEMCQEDERKNETCQQKISLPLRQSKFYDSAYHLAIQECTKYVGQKVLKDIFWVQFQATKVYRKQFSERDSDKAVSRIEYLQSEKIALNGEKI